jgi:hypothetical protein
VWADVQNPACDPATLIILLHARMPAGVTTTLTPDRRYAMFRMRMARAGTSTCPGCSFSGCLGSEVISVVDDRGLGWSASPGNIVAWQAGPVCAGGPHCGPTATRPSTWGTVKSLYR